MLFRTQEREMFALSVNVHQFIANLLEYGARYGASIDATCCASGAVQFTRKYQGIFFQRDAVFVQMWRNQVARKRVEDKDAFDARFVRARANEFTLGATAEQQAERIKDDGFARACFAGQDIKAWREFEGELVNDGEVGDGNFR